MPIGFIPRTDVEIITFRRSRGNGGQHNNKTATAIRITHLPTNERVEACKERSRTANLDAAWDALRKRLESIAANAATAQKHADWACRPEPMRGHWDRSYVLHRDQRIVDRRTGYTSDRPDAVLDGKLDAVIRADLVRRMAIPGGGGS